MRLVERVATALGATASKKGVSADKAPAAAASAALRAWSANATAAVGELKNSLACAQRAFGSVAASVDFEASTTRASGGPDVLFTQLDSFRGAWSAASAANRAARERDAREEYMAARKAERLRLLAEQREARVAAASAAANATDAGNGGAAAAAGVAVVNRGAVTRHKVRLPMDRGGARRAAAAAKAATTGAGRQCSGCGQVIRGWGTRCASCRASDGKKKRRGGGKAIKDGGGSASGDVCYVCAKHVYAAERLIAGGRLFHRKSDGHKGCFRCFHCQLPLSSANFSAAGRRVYCNVHFKRLFAEYGDYRFAMEEGEEVEGGEETETDVAEKVATATEVVAEPEAGGVAVAHPRSRCNTTAGSTAAALTAAAAVATPDTDMTDADEEGDVAATCYLYGDLRLPFALEEAWLRVRDPTAVTDWCVVSYARTADDSADDPTLLEVVGEGGGGLGACVECLSTTPSAGSRVFWGGLKVTAIDTRGTTSCERPKFLFFTCLGPAVSTRARTRALVHTGAVAEVLHGAHCAMEVEEPRADLEAGGLAKRLLAATGAHKPNAYDFGGGQVVRYDYYGGG